MNNVPCYSVLTLLEISQWPAVWAWSVWMFGNFETKSCACTTIVISAPLSVQHSSEIKKKVIKIIFIHFLVNIIQKWGVIHCRKRCPRKDFDWSVIKQCHRVQPMSDVILNMLHHLTLKMASAQVVETSVSYNSLS